MKLGRGDRKGLVVFCVFPQAEAMSDAILRVKHKYLRRMRKLMVDGESTIELVTDTEASSYIRKPYLQEGCNGESKSLQRRE